MPQHVRYRYNPSRGGHAPGHLRDGFVEGVYLFTEDYSGFSVEHRGQPRPLRWLIGQQWNCTDIMPWPDCELLELEQGSTYAQGVRKVARELAP